MTSSLHLTEDELRDACEYKQRKKQMEWCTQQGLRFRIAGNGRVKVLRSEYLALYRAKKGPPTDDGFDPDAI